jgi:hypothetical protein
VLQTRSNCMTAVSSDNLLPKVRRVCRLRGLRERRWSAHCTKIAIAAQAKAPVASKRMAGAGTGVYAAIARQGGLSGSCTRPSERSMPPPALLNLSWPRLNYLAFAFAVIRADHAVAIFVGTHIGDHFACLPVVGHAKLPE